MAAQPGWTRTGLHSGAPFMDGPTAPATLRLLATAWLGQQVEHGVIPLLDAALGSLSETPTYLGPDGFKELRGRRSAPARISLAGDARFQAWVVDKSIELTRTDLAI